ncbi:MAG: site-2 protease family protein [Thermoplasmata archaeon]|nr:site-2 protease family protein [Thermoplasmata archaeon]
MAGSSIRIGRIFGIPIRIHISFLIILPVFVWAFSMSSETILGLELGFGALESSDETRYLLATAAVLIFFATIVAHELAHSYVAMRHGVKIRSITLMIFGGVASMEEIPKKPREEMTMALAGPLTSLAIGLGAYGARFALGYWDGDQLTQDGLSALLGIISFYNILLAGFNLLPALPMDGGRVLRSILAMRMDHIDATRKAAKVARMVAISMAIVGVYYGNFFLIFIALFVYMGSKEEEEATAVSDSLEGVTVGQLMNRNVNTVPPTLSVRDLLGLMFTTGLRGFPVVDHRVVGIVTIAEAQKVPGDVAGMTMVMDIMKRDIATARPETEAAAALRLMADKRAGLLIVVDPADMILGVVTAKDILKMAEIMAARRRGGVFGSPWPPQPPIPPTASS